MVAEGSKRPQVSAAIPPRKIIVQKYAESRAHELESLHSIIANRVNNDYRSQRSKRRRTTAYDNQIARKRCRRKRKKLGMFDKSHTDFILEKDQIKKLPRRVRRNLELRMNAESGFCTSGDGTKRLRTHVWHAKRFTMTKLWGYYLPLGLQGRYCCSWIRCWTLWSWSVNSGDNPLWSKGKKRKKETWEHQFSCEYSVGFMFHFLGYWIMETWCYKYVNVLFFLINLFDCPG